MPHPDHINWLPYCKECSCQIGSGDYCYQHAPYMVWPLKDGTFRAERNGVRHIYLEEPPSHESEPSVDELARALGRLQALPEGRPLVIKALREAIQRDYYGIRKLAKELGDTT